MESFTVSVKTGGVWKTVANGTTIGYKRMFRFPEVEATALKLTINSTRGTANISKVSAFCVESVAESK